MNSTLKASIRMGARNDGMRNICELLINIVIVKRLKMLLSLDQNGKGYGWNVWVLFYVIYDSLDG